MNRRLWATSLGLLLIGCPAPEPETGRCGDGLVLIPETCDDLNLVDGDGCASNCTVESGWTCVGVPSSCVFGLPDGVCGDGVLNPGEACDEMGQTGSCEATCVFPDCGDAILNIRRGEQCDDGNTEDGDGCSRFCQNEPTGCGDGICTNEETCTACPMDCADQPRCAECPDMDGDGAADSACGGTDCNDFDNAVFPGATEVPCNRIDEDCDPSTPDALDEDGDGASCNFDCDDSDPDRSPFFIERCGNEVDDDCNDDTPDLVDFDRDGFSCDVDCNDFVATICPDCPEQCDNDRDDDCNPATPDEDADRDGDCAFDCDDSDPLRSTLLREVCGNEIDDDCDPMTADDVVDGDGDDVTCDLDCDDGDMSVVPDASGFCGPEVTYFEDFEDGDGGWVTNGTRTSWEHGVPNNEFIDAAASGTSAWVTDLDGDYENDELSWIESPAIDMSAALTDPVVRFSLIHELDFSDDFVRLDYSTDGGASWRRAGRSGEGIGWYPASDEGWTSDSGDDGEWTTKQNVLYGAAGAADLRLRFVFDSDDFTRYEGVGVDDVLVTTRFFDLGVASIGLGTELCAADAEPLQITVTNNSSVTAAAVEVSYRLDDAAPVTEMLAAPLAAGASTTHTFVAPIDLSMAGSRDLEVSVRAVDATDVFPANDTLAQTVDVVPLIVVTAAPFIEGFESGDGGFVASGTNSTWEHGAPSGSFITSAASGTSAWVTNLDGDYVNYEDSFLASPCFDFSGSNREPTLSFAHIYETESSFDGAWVEVWTAESGEWTKLGTDASGMNWYTDFDDTWSGDSGSAGVWRTASHPLTGARRQSRVRVRFRFLTDGSSVDEGHGIDDFTLVP